MTKKPVEASIEITDNGTGKIIETFTTNSATGKFIITLASGKNYGIAVKAEGYLFHSENFDIPQGSADNLVNKEIELKKIAIGSKIAAPIAVRKKTTVAGEKPFSGSTATLIKR